MQYPAQIVCLTNRIRGGSMHSLKTIPHQHRLLARRGRFRALVFVGLAILGAGSAIAQDSTPPISNTPVVTPAPPNQPATAKPERPPQKQSVRLHHIKVRGDLDNMCLAREVAEEIKNAQKKIEAASRGESGIEGLIVLELGSHRWRADVVRRIIESITDCPVRVIAFLSNSGDDRVGPGAMAIGLACERLYVDSKTSLRGFPADDAMSLAPKGTDAAQCRLQLAQCLRPLASCRTVDPLVVEAIVDPRTSLWLSPGEDGKRRLTPTPPTPPATPTTPPASPVSGAGTEPGSSSATAVGDSFQVVEVDPGGTGLRNHMPASVLVELGVASGSTENVGRLLAAENLIALPIVKSQVSNRLSAAAARVSEAMRSIDADLDAAEAALKKPPARDAKSQSEADRLARAVKQASSLMSQVERRIGTVDAHLLEYPELYQTPLPGQSETVTPPDKREAQWRSQLKKRRDRVEKIESKIRQMIPR